MSIVTTKTLRIGHSPDPDDAFMWWPLADFVGPDGTRHTPKVDTRGWRFEHVLEDIQSLNERSERGELEVTALSIHQYPYVAKDYVLTSCGASLGDGYGPMVVAREGVTLGELVSSNQCIAIPGVRTSAWLALQLRVLEEGTRGEGSAKPQTAHRVVPFDQIIQRVASGEFAAGLIIHEGQLTYRESGLVCVEDLGRWWKQTRGLPLPLGGNAIRRDVGSPEVLEEVCGVLLDSIRYALAHREEAVRFALQWARGMGHELADRFVGMYVNESTLDYGETGRAAVRRFLREGAEAGIVPAGNMGEVEFVGAG